MLANPYPSRIGGTYYIMPPMSGIAGPAGSGLSATTASVVKNIAATDAENIEIVTYYLYSTSTNHFLR
jgi:hypothetical protein